ncbi:MurR/RpiR family transcriptional regulator [Bosea sp. (in: a-proteobacteria)]|uniref:MurR/RpiR family transcriptional regulator n=1 Tax=Bosea sp. (in: a-proteobacteria) TaxID=1871050 RepID=UPI0025B8D732|nr:MurR/RpiR family transcriptional regulator [Bosea sp. (in: a-proteobacteria)]MBR3192806.1 MurR/RpiR family transcriptional regulator [Bosea sp. (in: a-proteobacteria)]
MPQLAFPLARLRAMLDDLPPTARRIASVIVMQPDQVLGMSVSELAAVARASEGSVIGLCQQIGARGFAELKITIAKEISTSRALLHEAITAGDSTADIVAKFTASHAVAIEDTVKVLDIGEIDRAARFIVDAKRIEFYGIGTAAPIAEDAAYRFLRLGLSTKAVTDSHAQAVSAAFTGPEVATLTISHSGRTHETLEATRLAKAAGARTICITNYGKSPLQQHCEITLFTAAQETKYRMEALSSRIAELFVIDVLYARLALLRWEGSLAAIQKSYDIIATKRVPSSAER